MEKTHNMKRHHLRWISLDCTQWERSYDIGIFRISLLSLFLLQHYFWKFVHQIFPLQNFCMILIPMIMMMHSAMLLAVLKPRRMIETQLHFWLRIIATHTILRGSNLWHQSKRSKLHKTQHHVHREYQQQRLILKSEVECKGSSDG